MFSYGLKLWSTNAGYIDSAAGLFREKIFHYLELFAVPGTYEKIGLWTDFRKNSGVPFVIHAPHYMAGMNLADPASRGKNRLLAEEALRFADALGAEKVIFHPGVNGRDEEAAAQLKSLYDPRMLVENKPYMGIIEGVTCAGYSPEGIKLIMEHSGVGFCLDIWHAIAAANALKKDSAEYLSGFLGLGPRMFHISDGDKASSADGHLHLGAGNYDFPGIVARLPANAMITIETEKKYQDRLDDCAADVSFLETLARRPDL